MEPRGEVQLAAAISAEVVQARSAVATVFPPQYRAQHHKDTHTPALAQLATTSTQPCLQQTDQRHREKIGMPRNNSNPLQDSFVTPRDSASA